MSYFSRQNLLIVPAQKWDENQPRVPAGQPGGGQFAGGGEGGGSGSVRHHPVSFGSEGYGVERVEETGGKGLRARGSTPERFESMEAARRHADIMNQGGSTIHGPQNRSDTGRAPLKGHPYHGKTEAELKYIMRDAGLAARAMGRDRPQQEGKYLDQMNDAATVLYHRRQIANKLPEIDPLARAPKAGNPKAAALAKYREGQARALWGKR